MTPLKFAHNPVDVVRHRDQTFLVLDIDQASFIKDGRATFKLAPMDLISHVERCNSAMAGLLIYKLNPPAIQPTDEPSVEAAK